VPFALPLQPQWGRFMSTEGSASSSQSPQTTTASQLFRDLFDSALVIAAFSALFYWIGFLIRSHDAERLGIPRELLPDASPEGLLALGFMVSLPIFGLLLLLYPLLALIEMGLKRQTPIWTVFRRHSTFYTCFALFAAMTLVAIAAENLPQSEWRFDDSKLPTVATLVLKDTAGQPKTDGLKFVCRRDGWVVFKRAGQKVYAVFRDENVVTLVLGAQTGPGAQEPAEQKQAAKDGR
jgi:hypothetical protein